MNSQRAHSVAIADSTVTHNQRPGRCGKHPRARPEPLGGPDMPEPYALESPAAPLTDPALLAAAGFLAGYSGTTRVGYTIDLKSWWAFCETNGLDVLDAKRPHVELFVRSMEEGSAEIQRIMVNEFPLRDDLVLTYRAEETDPIPCDADSSNVQAALERLPTIGAGNITVTGDQGCGWWAVMFTGRLANQALPLLGAQGFSFEGIDPKVAVERVARGRRPYARSTTGRRLSTVASFYKWCLDEEVIGRNPAANVRRPKISQDSTTLGLDRQELGQFLVEAGLAGGRDHALACLLGLNGLRVSEACNADIDYLGFERGHHTLIVDRKGGKRAIIPLAPRTHRAIALAIGERTSGPILLGPDGQRLDRYAAYRIVRRLARRAGIAHKVHPHCLRHAFITAALDAGVPLRDVQEAASHTDPRTTSRYDRHRVSLDRHAAYTVAAFVAGATNGR